MKGLNHDRYHDLRAAGEGACFCLRYAKEEGQGAHPISLWCSVVEVQDHSIWFKVMNGNWSGHLQNTIYGAKIIIAGTGAEIMSDILPYEKTHQYSLFEPENPIYDWHK